MTELSGQLNALFALSSEKDTPCSFHMESGLWRRAVSSPLARSFPVGPATWLLRLAGKVMDCMLGFRSEHHGIAEVDALPIAFRKTVPAM